MIELLLQANRYAEIATRPFQSLLLLVTRVYVAWQFL